MKKQFFSVLLLSSFLLILNSCNKKETEKYTTENPLILVMAEVNPADTIVGQSDIAFQQKVAELSGGKMIIDLKLNGILGNVEETLKLMLIEKSPVQIVRITPSTLVMYDCDKNGLLSIPYTFSSREHFWKFIESDLSKEFLDEPYERKTNIKGLYYGEEGFRNFFSISPLTSTADFSGKKIRIPEDSILDDMVISLEATPIRTGFGEMFVAMQTGSFQIAEQPVNNYLANSFYIPAPYLILDYHTLGITETVINAGIWDSLTKEQQDILIEAGTYASKVCKEISEEVEERSFEKLKAEGVTITEVKDITPWKGACKRIINEYSSKNAYLYKQLEKTGK